MVLITYSHDNYHLQSVSIGVHVCLRGGALACLIALCYLQTLLSAYFIDD